VVLLTKLTQYLMGEFENRTQAIADPIWFVHLHLWHRPVALFSEDSVALFAEQANILQLDQPYRQRLLRIQVHPDPFPLQVQYYRFLDPGRFKGAAAQPTLLSTVTLNDIELLPGCVLPVRYVQNEGSDRFIAQPLDDKPCCFPYAGKTRQVCLGFEASPDEFLSYDKGIDPETGQGIWGAMMGAYRFQRN
jgi:hypothetical protein